MVSDLIKQALEFGLKAHGDQERQWTKEPYFNHCIEVARFVEEVGGDDAMIAAALLHDVVEDTPVTIEDIRTLFGEDVAALVDDLTDVSKHEDGIRAVRKAIDRQHSSKASPRAQTIKLADLKSNTTDIVLRNPGFAKVYMPEKRALLEIMRRGDARLYGECWKLLLDYEETYGKRPSPP